MQMRSDIQLTALIRAMKDVVIPAIDPANRLAIEQSQLVLGMLALMQKQLPMQFRFDRDELSRLLGTADRLAEACATEPALRETVRALVDVQQPARQRFVAAIVDPAELYGDVMALREAIGSLVTHAGEAAAPALMSQIERQVLDLSREQILRDRALMAPQGWEPGLPAVETLLEKVGPGAG